MKACSRVNCSSSAAKGHFARRVERRQVWVCAIRRPPRCASGRVGNPPEVVIYRSGNVVGRRLIEGSRARSNRKRTSAAEGSSSKFAGEFNSLEISNRVSGDAHWLTIGKCRVCMGGSKLVVYCQERGSWGQVLIRSFRWLGKVLRRR